MDFLFGKKYPIFNEDGEIEHSRKDRFEEWKSRYKNSSERDWRNHSGQSFKESGRSKRAGGD